MFKRVYRLTKDYEHKKVWRFGRRISSEFFDLRFLRNNEPFSRLAFVASKKVGKAVERHRALRLLREAVRLNYETINHGFWLVFYCKKEMKDLKLKDVLPPVRQALSKIL